MKGIQVKPFWVLYPTPIYNKEESSRFFHGKVYNHEYDMEYTSMVSIGNKIAKDGYYNNRLKKLSVR